MQKQSRCIFTKTLYSIKENYSDYNYIRDKLLFKMIECPTREYEYDE